MDTVLKMCKVFILSCLFASSLCAAIARTGSCSTTGNQCNVSATATGDLKITFAFDSGSTTIPTTSAGWTSITSQSTASGGTTAAQRTGCNVSSSSSDIGGGTWTGATAVVTISYSGTNVGTTANCNTTGVGAFINSNAKSSTSASYGGITLNGTVSWVDGFMGGTGSSTCTPSGMTSVSATGTVRGSDTNAVVSSWSTTTCSVTSETWMSMVAEILGVPPVVTCALSTALLGVGCR